MLVLGVMRLYLEEAVSRFVSLVIYAHLVSKCSILDYLQRMIGG
jgi:hypothetical protein